MKDTASSKSLVSTTWPRRSAAIAQDTNGVSNSPDPLLWSQRYFMERGGSQEALISSDGRGRVNSL